MDSETVFTFSTTHNAINGEKALLSAGVGARVMPRPSALGQGCGICLRVDDADRERAVAALDAAGVVVEALFAKIRHPDRTEYRKLYRDPLDCP